MTDALAAPDPPGSVDYDCLIVGGGPAGLTAAVYLARFHRSCLVVDGGCSRASLVPKTRNYPGFPPGISGDALLERLREQALTYGAHLQSGTVEQLEAHPLGFRAGYGQRSCIVRRVILASGIEDSLPQMANVEDAIASGQVRLCAICDGYEVKGESVAVYGEIECAIGHAVFLRTFTDRITVLAEGALDACDESLALAARYGIRLVGGPVRGLRLHPEKGVEVRAGDDEVRHFDILYPCLGARFRSELATQLRAKCLESGALIVDEYLQTSVPGLYAIGDVVEGLKQMSVAVGQAAQAATAIHNGLEVNLWPAAVVAAER